jgi:hypothetical protein
VHVALLGKARTMPLAVAIGAAVVPAGEARRPTRRAARPAAAGVARATTGAAPHRPETVIGGASCSRCAAPPCRQ